MFPELDDEVYLVSLWERVGFCSNFGMGRIPLTWSEINNWIQATKIDLSTWEVETIATMSEIYAIEVNAKEKDRPMPYMEITEQSQISLNNKWKAVFSKYKADDNEQVE